ncbi:hypothetical protein Tco_0653496 [Tanacetum coccineum]|uniref:Uncharacterized protein n=1 Tax=Tanacetum coccineum TaxID=301880 RepID=A0ABQ4X0J3_9ASTR
MVMTGSHLNEELGLETDVNRHHLNIEERGLKCYFQQTPFDIDDRGLNCCVQTSFDIDDRGLNCCVQTSFELLSRLEPVEFNMYLKRVHALTLRACSLSHWIGISAFEPIWGSISNFVVLEADKSFLLEPIYATSLRIYSVVAT